MSKLRLGASEPRSLSLGLGLGLGLCSWLLIIASVNQYWQLGWWVAPPRHVYTHRLQLTAHSTMGHQFSIMRFIIPMDSVDWPETLFLRLLHPTSRPSPASS